jgi:hypothetical protein
MAKTYKPGFLYLKSGNLKQEIAMNRKTGWVYCEDGAQYSPQEMLLFYEAGSEIDAGVHIVRKVFNGEVIKIERNVGTNGQAKQIESGGGTDTPNNKSSGEKIQGDNEAGTANASGELDIY